MKRWDSDPGLRQLVAEHREGILGRREFLARLGAAAAGAAAASLVGSARPASAQKKIVVTMWDTEPNPATACGGEGNRRRLPQAPQGHRDPARRAWAGATWTESSRRRWRPRARRPRRTPRPTWSRRSGPRGSSSRSTTSSRRSGRISIFPSVLRWLKYPDGKYWGLTHAWGADNLGGRGDYLARHRCRPADVEDVGRLAPRPAEAQQGAPVLRRARSRASRSS